ncbi:hypothetical protein Mapa_009071 [Marchantia paleacea]|nr:hypothetical protein Mapa_009071 [Marchantia paleacea]
MHQRRLQYKLSTWLLVKKPLVQLWKRQKQNLMAKVLTSRCTTHPVSDSKYSTQKYQTTSPRLRAFGAFRPEFVTFAPLSTFWHDFWC